MEELLPPASWRLEDLRQALFACFRQARYELVYPPMVEHLDSLLSGAGAELEAQTFKLIDPLSGRLIGLRSDMTPQVARIAARRYSYPDVVRLCYLGTVLRTAPDAEGGPRSPRQVGCEIFGDSSAAADFEIIDMMMHTLRIAGVAGAHLDLGHAGIFNALVGDALDPADEQQLFDILQRKSAPDLRDFARGRALGVDPQRIAQLMTLHGDVDVLQRARAVLPASTAIGHALDALEACAAHVARVHPQLPLHVDLAELRGSRYHRGLVYAAFAPGLGREIARGGRYDDAGREFGLSLPATGFSADINELLAVGNAAI